MAHTCLFDCRIDVLDLSRTNVSGTLPVELGQLDLLNRLVLSNTLLSGAIPANVSKLSRLRKFQATPS